MMWNFDGWMAAWYEVTTCLSLPGAIGVLALKDSTPGKPKVLGKLGWLVILADSPGARASAQHPRGPWQMPHASDTRTQLW